MEAPATASDAPAMDWSLGDELTGRPLWNADDEEDGYSLSDAGTTERPWQSPYSGSVFGRQAVWLCRSCDSPQWTALTSTIWECEKCGSHEFYDATVPTTFSSTLGSWTYVPMGSDGKQGPDRPTPPGGSPDGRSPVKAAPSSTPGGRWKSMRPDDPGQEWHGERQAESEAATEDVMIDPDTGTPVGMSRRQRRALRRRVAADLNPKPAEAAQPRREASSTQPNTAKGGERRPSNDWRDDMLRSLHDYMIRDKDKDKDKNKEWNNKKGPQPGIKFRGGAPPQPPTWSYARDDLRAFQKWERRIRIWQEHVSSYVPPNEAAMLLYCSLRGECEEELEWAPLDKINSDSGVDFILDSLRKPLMTRTIYLKRRYLHEFEQVSRVNGESIRAYCNRYGRVERALQSVGIDITTVYDREARGSRLLDRMRLSLDQQRLILTSTGQDLDYDKIKEASQLQFPEHRPVPALVYGREFDREYPGKGSSSSSPSAPHRSFNTKGKSKGKSKSKHDGKGFTTHAPQRTFTATIPEEEEMQEEEEEYLEAEEYEDEEADQDGAADLDADDADENESWISDLEKAAECLTVTARRLQGLTLGRKYTGTKSIQQRKSESHCSACGVKGHWKGDPECTYSEGKDGKDGKGSKGAGKSKNDGKAKKVLSINHPDGTSVSFSPEVEVDDKTEPKFGTFFTYMVWAPTIPVHRVHATAIHNFADYLVLDTACQRSCCSSTWLETRMIRLQDFRLRPYLTPNQEPFEFGHGEIQYSHEHAQIPSGFDGSSNTVCLLGCSVLDKTNDIPFLGSSQLLSGKLKAVLDFPKQVAHLHALGVSVPVCLVNGHVALNISKFPKSVHELQGIWKELHGMCQTGTADPEFVQPSAFCQLSRSSASYPHAEDASDMAHGLAENVSAATCSREAVGDGDAPGRQVGHSTSAVAGPSGSHGHGDPRCVDEEGRGSLRASSHPTVGQQAREVRQVPGLRQEVEVGRSRGPMGRLSNLARTAATAIALIIHGSGLRGPITSSELGQGHSGPDPIFIDSISHGILDDSIYGIYTEDAGRQAQDSAQEGYLGGGAPQRLRLEPSRDSMKKGRAVWLTGHLRNVRKSYEMEVNAYQSQTPHSQLVKDGSLVDLLEVYAGTANVTSRASYFGLRTLQPVDLNNGFDLTRPEDQATVMRAVRSLRPLLLLVAWPCTVWSVMNENCNYSHRLDDLEKLREEQRVLVRFGVELCREQLKHGRLFLGENVLRSRLWQEPEVRALLDEPDSISFSNDAGAFGAEDSQGGLIIKSHRWVTNSSLIAEQLNHRLTPEQKLYATPIEGRETGPSGHYCDGLADAILRGLQREVHFREPGRMTARVLAANQVPRSGVIADEQLWSNVLDQAEGRFTNTYKKPFTLIKSDPLYVSIGQLIPWDIQRIQIAWTPQARRWPTDIPFDHRAAILRASDGQFSLEVEDLSAIPYPRQRFSKSMRVGIFVFGMYKDEPAEQDRGDQDTPGQEFQMPQQLQRVQGVTTEIWFEDAPKEINKQLKSALARLHCNMGHPDKAELVRIMAASGHLNAKVLAGLDALRCGSCIRMSKTIKPPVSSTMSTAPTSFGDRLQSDVVYIRTLTQNVPVLGIVDELTNYTVAKALPDRRPTTMLKTFQEVWYRPLGLPHHLTVDPDTAFLGEMQDWHLRHGVNYHIIPAEEHWKIGKVERRNSLLRSLTERLVDEHAVTTIQGLDEVLLAATHSLNSCTYSHGRSPYTAVFGKVPRPLGDNFSDEHALIQSPSRDEHLLPPELLRAEAITALSQLSASQAVRRALLRKTRHQKDATHLQPGQPVAFWRWTGKSRQHKRGSWNLGRFLGHDPDRKSVWIQVGKNSLRVGTTQLRPAVGWESWTPSEEDVQLLKDAEANIAQGLWGDAVEDGPGEEEAAAADYDLMQFRMVQEAAAGQQQHKDERAQTADNADEFTAEPLTAVSMPISNRELQHEAPTEQHPEAGARFTVQQQAMAQTSIEQTNMQQMQSTTQLIDQRHVTINIDSPTYQRFGSAGFGPMPPTPRSRRGRSRTPSRASGAIQRPAEALPAPDTGLPASPSAATATLTEQQQAGATEPVDADMQAETTSKRAAEQAPEQLDATRADAPAPQALTAILAHYEIMDDGVAYLTEHWDGSPDITLPHAGSKQFYQAYLNSSSRKAEMADLPDPSRPDHSSDDEDLQLSNERRMTRQEVKQLDREIPWRDIMQLDIMARDKYVQSAVNEFQGWVQWAGVRPLSESEAQAVWKDPRLRRRILKSRAAYRDKNRGTGELKAKTRVVLVGCGDPDLRQLTRDSPTPTRLSEFIILSIATAGANKIFNQDGRTWTLWLSDAEKAFLQGKQDMTERNGAIYMMPPRDPILAAAGAFPAPLYEVTGNCYGLANAPRVWYVKVDTDLRTKAKFKRHSFDRCFYYHHGSDGLLDCVLIVHVDDFLATYSESFDLAILEGLFKWGSTTKITEDTSGVYRGKEIALERRDGKLFYNITQKSFVDHLEEGKLPPGRLQKDKTLTPEEVKEFRSVCGCLQWLGGQTRPEVAAAASLCHRGQETDVTDLRNLYETLSFVKATPESGIVFPPVPLDKTSVIVSFGDSSWANAANYSSQYGVVVTICPSQVTEATTNALLVDWKSGRSTRVCRSTLASEASAADEACDRACFVNYVLSELLFNVPAYRGNMSLNMLQCTDAKSLYDCLVAENPSLTDRRSMVQIRSVQQSMGPKQIHWIPTGIMHADPLTKLDAKLRAQMVDWLRKPFVKLRDDGGATTKQRPV